MAQYTYTIPPYFSQGVLTSQLQSEIDASTISSGTVIRIDTYGNDVYILFDNTLTAPDVITLNNIVNAHVPNYAYTTPSVISNVFVFRDATDQSKGFVFNGNTIPTDTIITLNVPSSSTTLVGSNSTQTLSNKSLIDASTSIVNISDSTKSIKFSAGSGTTGTSTTLASSQTVNRTLTLPNATDNIVSNAFTATLTNKTITGSTNYVGANELKTTGSPVIISSSTPPITGQVLISTSSTSAVWRSANLISGAITLQNNGSNVTGTPHSKMNFTSSQGITISASNSGSGVAAISVSVPTTTKGDLIVYNGTTNVRQPVGTNDFLLTGNSTATTGISWSPPVFKDSLFKIVNSSDSTKQIIFSSTGTTGTSTTIRAPQTANRTLTLPNATDNIVSNAFAATLTNKTITGSTNYVGANELKTTGSPVVISTAAPPVTGQVLVATSATSARWAAVSGGTNSINVQNKGTNVPSTPHTTLNFTGSGVNATNSGSGVAQINIPGLRLNNQTGNVQTLVTGNVGLDFNIASTGNVHTFNIPSASITQRGLVTTGLQFYNGPKVFVKSNSSPSYVGAASNGVTNSSSITINVPTGTTGLDMIMVCIITVRNGYRDLNNSIPYTDTRLITSPPSGWTLLSTQVNTVSYPRTIFIYVKQASFTEPSSYTWSGIQPSPSQTYTGTVTASFSGTTMTVTVVGSGALTTGQTISGTGIPGGTTITAFGSGSGGTGTYTISTSLTLSSRTVNATIPKTNMVVGGIVTFSSASAYSAIDAIATQATPNGSTHATPPLTTSVQNTIILTYYSVASSFTSWTLGAGQTQATFANNTPPPQAIGEGMTMGYFFQSSAATIGPYTATVSNDPDVGLTAILALRSSAKATVTIQANIGQSGDLLDMRDYGGNIRAGFNYDGQLFIADNTGPKSAINPNVITIVTQSPITTDYTVQVPGANTLLVGNNTVNTLTNKTITGATNYVGADELKTISTPVVVNLSQPPVAGQVLVSTSTTNAVWSTLSPVSLPYSIISQTISSDQNNYNPAGLQTATQLRITPSGATRTITGLQSYGTASTHPIAYLIISNVDTSNNLILSHQSASSTSSNRFLFDGQDIVLVPGQSIIVYYDYTSTAWRNIAASSLGTLGGTFITNGVISPATLSSDQNDYNPTGLSNASVIRLSSNTPVSITGISGGVSGRQLILLNTTSNPIQLIDSSTSSSSQNRFLLGGGGTLTLINGSVVVLIYDGVVNNWRALGGTGGTSTGGLVQSKWVEVTTNKSTTVTTWPTVNTKINAVATLPTSTLTVVSTTGYPPIGTIYIQTNANGSQAVNYTGKTTTTFTGCTGGTGSLSVGNYVWEGPNICNLASGSSGVSLPQTILYTTSSAPFPSSGTILVNTASGQQTVTYTGKFTESTTMSVTASLPTSPITVVSTSGFPTSGRAYVLTTTGYNVLSYTGRTATTFTGVTGGTGSAQINNPVHLCTTIAAGSNNVALPTSTINVVSTSGFPSSGKLIVQWLTTIAAGSNGANLPQATINVTSTTGFPTSGTLLVTSSNGQQTVTYTGRTGTTFTGCSGGTGSMSTGGSVTAYDPAAISYTGTTGTSFTGCTGGSGTMTTGQPVLAIGFTGCSGGSATTTSQALITDISTIVLQDMMGINITTNGGALIITASICGNNLTNNATVFYQVCYDGVVLRGGATRGNGGAPAGSVVIGIKLSGVPAGEHYLVVRWRVDSGTGVVYPVSNPSTGGPEQNNASLLVQEVSS